MNEEKKSEIGISFSDPSVELPESVTESILRSKDGQQGAIKPDSTSKI